MDVLALRKGMRCGNELDEETHKEVEALDGGVGLFVREQRSEEAAAGAP